MNTYSDIEKKLSSSILSWGNAASRSGALPIERFSIFNSYEAARLYALGGNEASAIPGHGDGRGLAYEGQIVAVSTDLGQVAYVLDHSMEDGLRRVGSDPGSICADISAIVNASISSLTVADISAASGKIVDKIWQTNGKLSATYRDLTLGEVEGAAVTVEKLDTPEGDAYATYHVKQGGTKVGDSINIPKDKVISSAYMVNVTGSPVSATSETISSFAVKYEDSVSVILSDDTVVGGESVAEGTFSSIKNAYFGEAGGDGPYLRIAVSNQACPVYIAMPKLVDTYSGEETSSIKVTVDNRKISAVVKDNAISTSMIVDSAVTHEKVATDAIETENIKDSAVDNAKIADSAVNTAKLSALAVTTEKIADSAVTEAKLATDSVTTDKIKDANVTTVKIANSAINSDKISADAVITSKIANGAVTSDKIADDAITTGKIADGAVETQDIKDLAVTHAKIAVDAVEAVNILSSAVTTVKIADKAVTTAKLDDDSVTTIKIVDNAITTNKISAEAVTTAKIADKNVTKAKLADDATAYIEDQYANAVSYTNGVSAFLSGDYAKKISDAGTAIANEVAARDASDKYLSGTFVPEKISGLCVALSTATNAKVAAEAEIRSEADQYLSGTFVPEKISGLCVALSTTVKAEIAAEALARDTSDTYLSTTFATEVRTALSAYARETSANALTQATTKIENLSVELKGDISTEASNRAQAINDLSVELKGDISSEETRAKGIETTISTDLDKLESAVSTISANHETRITTVEGKVAKLSSAMHFKGVNLTAELSTGSTAIPIPPYKSGETPEPGDVVIVKDSKEFVWALSDDTKADSGQWYELGAEGIWATKASLEAETEAREAADTALDTRITNLSTSFDDWKTDEYETNKAAVALSVGGISSTVYAEIEARKSADTDLDTRITNLSTEVKNLSSTTNAEIAAEASVRAAADSALSGDVTTLTNNLASARTDINTVSVDLDTLEANAVLSVKINGQYFTVENNLAEIELSSINCGGAED